MEWQKTVGVRLKGLSQAPQEGKSWGLQLCSHFPLCHQQEGCCVVCTLVLYRGDCKYLLLYLFPRLVGLEVYRVGFLSGSAITAEGYVLVLVGRSGHRGGVSCVAMQYLNGWVSQHDDNERFERFFL